MSLNGIDISHWQVGINLSAVSADFVIIKATEGTTYVDPEFDKNYADAKASGKLLGVYHYADGGNVQAEADHFLEKVNGTIKEAILCLDWEGQNNPLFGKDEETEWVKQWCDYVTAKTGGVKPLVYCSASVLSRLKGIREYNFWVAQYANTKVVNGYQETPWNEGAYTCTIRQYSSRGQLPGYIGNLDLDKFYGDANEWKKLANPETANQPTVQPVKKSNDEIAQEVISGAWGNGDDRKNRLIAAGYDFNAIQAIVNSKVAPKPVKKSNEQIAQEVISGAWGNGADRINRLTAAGYDVSAIQSIINSKLGKTASAKKSNAEIAKEIIRGTCSDSRWSTWGTGNTRKERLRAAGYNPSTVQSEVNRLL